MSGKDRILVKDLRLRGIVGLNDWEREKQQDIVINLVIYTDMRAAGASDDVADTLNYRTITKRMIQYVEGSQHYLVEALATGLARLAVVEMGAERVRIRVEKPGALRFADSVGVEIERDRSDFDE
jgi:FolB domain-containing protein